MDERLDDGSSAAFERAPEAEVFRKYASIIRRLRAPDGCPWDRGQTLPSLRRYIIEEAFEAVAAIDDATESGTFAEVADELGDLFLVALLTADALEKEGSVSLSTVLTSGAEKLVRRHPHVFGETIVADETEVTANWNEIKRHQEGRSSRVDAVSEHLSPLERSRNIQKRAGEVGFDWGELEPVLAKIEEELNELRAVIAERIGDGAVPRDSPEVEEELGDLLFSVVNVARHLKADPTIALERTNRKFIRRFRAVEDFARESGRNMTSMSLDELEGLWLRAKKGEHPEIG
jgi:tetrapyrrole methylase family protein/MazG family protein